MSILGQLFNSLLSILLTCPNNYTLLCYCNDTFNSVVHGLSVKVSPEDNLSLGHFGYMTVATFFGKEKGEMR